MINIVLVEPEIPQNTGNIARTCAATGTGLILVGELGFSTDDRYLKRAGLDYWDKVNIKYVKNIEQLFAENENSDFYFSTTKARNVYTENDYSKPGDIFFVFGKETRGLPEVLLRQHKDKCIRIPMAYEIRSLNLSNSVSIVLYEALRQRGFENMMKTSAVLE